MTNFSASLDARSPHFLDTAHAFDSVAGFYDSVAGNNPVVQIMRAELWRAVTLYAPAGSRLLDLGCGTGIDAAHFAHCGYHVTGVDASPEMVNQTRARAAHLNLDVQVENFGAQELALLDSAPFDAIYSDLGPLNCVPDLRVVSEQCAAHLKPNGNLVFSVISRVCPWEILYFSLRGNFNQARRRFPCEMVPVKLEDGIVWTRYYTPREFYESFGNEFQLVTYRALNLFLPPPYLLRWYERASIFMKPLAWLDGHLDALPLLRDAGDHFLMVMTRKPTKQENR